jgi:6-phosphogluconolactonase (cycloisomerase 2 family)
MSADPRRTRAAFETAMPDRNPTREGTVQKIKRLGLAAGTVLATTLALPAAAAAAAAPAIPAAPAAPAAYASTHTAVTTSATSGATTGAAAKHCPCEHDPRNVVFVQTDNVLGNQIVAYRRADDGTLSWSGVYDTGGLGGVLSGSVADHLASQGSLTYDSGHGLLYAVNAGSNTVSVFSVDGDRLTLRQVLRSGGKFPVSIAVHGNAVYVLNALAGGSVQGFLVGDGRLTAVPAWRRALGLDPNATPQFTNTPGQVGFTGDGTQLVVTTKFNGTSLDVFRLGRDGGLVGDAVVTPQPGAAPFGFVGFGPRTLLVADSDVNAVATVGIGTDGTATTLGAADTEQSATCWVTRVGGFLYASNAGSNTVSGFRINSDGLLSSIADTPTDPGPVDSAASADGRFLYVQTGGNGVVDEFKINTDGSLTSVGTQPVPNAVGGEGIVAF